MTGPGPERGWKDRRDKSNAKSAAHDERAAIRAERARAEQERIAASLAAAAVNALKQALARCSCPACGGEGIVTVELATRLIEAMRRLPASETGDPAVLATLNAIVEGKPVELAAAYSTDLGLKRPKKVYASAPPVEHGEPAVITPKDEPIVVPTKPKRKPTATELYAADGDENALDLG